jgi:hypothetical protein
MDRTGGRVAGPQALHPITDSANSFLVLRTSKLVEIVGPGHEDNLLVNEKPGLTSSD